MPISRHDALLGLRLSVQNSIGKSRACVCSLACILRSGESFLLLPELCRVGIQQLLMSPGRADGRGHQAGSRPALACFCVGISNL